MSASKSMSFKFQIGRFLVPNFFKKTPQNICSIQTIRVAMLEELGQDGAEKFPLTHLRISYAEDVQDLWYLRGDVMTAISTFDGELIASKKIKQINQMFNGLLPHAFLAPTARPNTATH